MTQGSLFPTEPCYVAPETVKAFMCIWEPPCHEKASLGPKRFNISSTAMNRTATCLKCGKRGELSVNLTLPKGKAMA